MKHFLNARILLILDVENKEKLSNIKDEAQFFSLLFLYFDDMAEGLGQGVHVI
jgi:hypothetical protein